MAAHFGEHITIDGYGGDPDRLNSEEAVLSALTEICDALRMRPLMKPMVIPAPDNHIKDPGGWSGFVIIAESHVSIHTFPKRRFVSADVYTCQNGMNKEYIVDFFKKKFRLEDVEVHFIKRGTRYPTKNIVP
ncbi:MAG: adenosylmethionine decarboxylase [bacterium]|nr:adenosylmethionine decarboxylase [bacterium]